MFALVPTIWRRYPGGIFPPRAVELAWLGLMAVSRRVAQTDTFAANSDFFSPLTAKAIGDNGPTNCDRINNSASEDKKPVAIGVL